jgi:hypothetical protein
MKSPETPFPEGRRQLPRELLLVLEDSPGWPITALKVMYPALKNPAAKLHSLQNRREALNCFAMLWEDRFPTATQAMKMCEAMNAFHLRTASAAPRDIHKNKTQTAFT